MKKTFYFLLCLLLTMQNLSGQVQRTFSEEIKSQALNEQRLFTVTVPKGYHTSGKDYPVFLVLDAEWNYDLVTGTVDFYTNDLTGFAPEMIVVGVYNTDRGRDMNVRPGQEGTYSAFMDFLDQELLSYIDSKYRTNDYRLIYGWSSGAAVAHHFFAARPEVFDAYIFSGFGIGPNTHRYALANLPTNTYQNARLYAGCEGDSPPRIAGLKKFDAMMDSLSLEGVSYTAEVREAYTHLEVLGDGIVRGLEVVFEPFRMTNELATEGATGIKQHYQNLARMYGFQIVPPVGALVEAASLTFDPDNLNLAEGILTYGLEVYPNSAALRGTLGEIYSYAGKPVQALQQYKLALQLAEKTDRVSFRKYQTLIDALEN